jgi:hypothetical protein
MGSRRATLPGLAAAKRRFREIFPRGFADPTYLAWERDYKWAAHLAWRAALNQSAWRRLLEAGDHREICARIVRFYARSKLNMLALYEWMALREALEDSRGARILAPALYDLVHGGDAFGSRLERFVETLDRVPQRQTRLAKWPVVTLFPFVAQPTRHLVVKPRLMKRTAEQLGFEIAYRPQPNAATYTAVVRAASVVRQALARWNPRDLIDVQGFIWVTSSEEYETWPWDE